MILRPVYRMSGVPVFYQCTISIAPKFSEWHQMLSDHFCFRQLTAPRASVEQSGLPRQAWLPRRYAFGVVLQYQAITNSKANQQHTDAASLAEGIHRFPFSLAPRLTSSCSNHHCLCRPLRIGAINTSPADADIRLWRSNQRSRRQKTRRLTTPERTGPPANLCRIAALPPI